MDYQKALQTSLNKVEGLSTRDNAFILGLRLVMIPLAGLWTKPRSSGNGQTSLFYPGGYASNFARNGQATSWPFMWYSGDLKVAKATSIERVETPQGERILVGGTKVMSFAYWDEEAMESLPFNLNLQFGPSQLKDLLRGEKGEMLKSPAGMQGAWYAMQAELLERGNTQLQVLLIPGVESASSIQVAPFHGGSHKVATWELQPGDLGSVTWASKGDATYTPGLGLAEQVVDVSAWEQEAEKPKASVVGVNDLIPPTSKVKTAMNKKYGPWLKGEKLVEQSQDPEVQMRFLREAVCRPGTAFGKWLNENENKVKAHQWLTRWKPRGYNKGNGMGQTKPEPQPEPKPEPQPEPKPEPQPEPKPEPEMEAAKPQPGMGLTNLGASLVGDFEDDFE